MGYIFDSVLVGSEQAGAGGVLGEYSPGHETRGRLYHGRAGEFLWEGCFPDIVADSLAAIRE